MANESTEKKRPARVSVSLRPADWKEIRSMAECQLLFRFKGLIKDVEKRQKTPAKKLSRDVRYLLDGVLALRALKTALHEAGVTAERDYESMDEFLLMLIGARERGR